MSYQPPSYDAASIGVSDDPYVAPAYDAVDFGSAAGLSIAAPKTQITIETPQSVTSGAGAVVLNAPETSINVAAPTADVSGSGAVDINVPKTPFTIAALTPNLFTPRRRGSPPAKGWFVEVDHPDTGRTITPDVLDLADAPTFIPGPNAQPELRLPVRKDTTWLTDAYNSDPEMRVWKDGKRLPIDVLRDVEQREGATILIGIGGVELEDRVVETYATERRHRAAEQLITAETSYQADVDTPVIDTLTDQLQYELSTTADFSKRTTATDTDPIVIENGETRVAQTSWTKTASDLFALGTYTAISFSNQDGYVGGDQLLFDTVGQYAEFEIDLEYTQPVSEFGNGVLRPSIRGFTEGGAGVNRATFEVQIDGTPFSENLTVGDNEIEWNETSENPSVELTPGTYTVRFEVTEFAQSGDTAKVDVFNVRDERFSYNLDNTLSSTQGQLDGPELYPPVTEAGFTDAVSPFAVVGGSASIVIDDTSGGQFLQVSNDRGDTFVPDDGSENNTTNVDVDFADDGAAIRPRVGLARYGSRTDATPATGYQAQRLSELELRADIEQTLLLLDRDFDAALVDVFNEIAGEYEFVWSYNIAADGTPQISWTEPGQRVADQSPELSKRVREKRGTTYPSITIKGSPQPVTDERFSASTSFVNLAEDNLLSGSDAVSDPDTGENFTRDVDYEIDRETGQIRIISAGAMDAGQEYSINYRHKIAGTFTDPNASADATTGVENVPGATSERAAEQVAFAIVNEFNSPRYIAEVTIPDATTRFDPIAAIPASAFGLPDAAPPLEPRGESEITERGLRVRYGTRPSVEAGLQQINRQLGRISDRS